MITNDAEFLESTKKVKKLLKVDDIEELESRQAEMIREELSDILRYVMERMQEEEQQQQEEQQPTESSPSAAGIPEQPAPPAPAPAPAPATAPGTPMSVSVGGRSKKRRVKGGNPMDMDRILNAGSLKDTRPAGVSTETQLGSFQHAAFSAGHQAQFSSVGGLPDAQIATMLPKMGSQSGGGRRKK
jgi:hypothetical protein